MVDDILFSIMIFHFTKIGDKLIPIRWKTSELRRDTVTKGGKWGLQGIVEEVWKSNASQGTV